MSAQPVDGCGDQLGPRFVLTWRQDGVEVVVDLDDLDDDAFDQLPEKLRGWQPAGTHAAVEDIRWMARHGESAEGICARLTELRGKPVTRVGLERFLHRYGAHDVVHMLTHYGDDLPPVRSRPQARERYTAPEQAGPQPQGRVGPGGPFARLARGGHLSGRRLA